MSDAAGCFSGRVDDYVKTRPSYPRALLAVLRDRCDLRAASVVADLGSGTGLFTRLIRETGATVHAVEPNDEMRAAAEAMSKGWNHRALDADGFHRAYASADCRRFDCHAEGGSIAMVYTTIAVTGRPT